MTWNPLVHHIFTHGNCQATSCCEYLFEKFLQLQLLKHESARPRLAKMPLLFITCLTPSRIEWNFYLQLFRFVNPGIQDPCTCQNHGGRLPMDNDQKLGTIKQTAIAEMQKFEDCQRIRDLLRFTSWWLGTVITSKSWYSNQGANQIYSPIALGNANMGED